MSTLAEIEQAIEHLPSSQLEELAIWLAHRRVSKTTAHPASEPDFLARARAIWGDNPVGKPLSEVVSESRN